MLDGDDDETGYDIMLVKHTMGESSYVGQNIAHRYTIYDALEHFIAAGQTTEILGYYPRLTAAQRSGVYYDTIEAEEREYP